MKTGKWKRLAVFVLLAMLLAGCVSPRVPPAKCTVLLEDHPALYIQQQIWEIRRYEDVTVSIGVPKGERIAGVNYHNYSVSAKTGTSKSFDYYDLTLHQIGYSAVIRITTAPAYTTAYHAGGGIGESIVVLEESPHLYFNTLPYRQQFNREEYVPIGWNTRPDGSGIQVGFGSRIDHRAVSHMELYVQWAKQTPESAFAYEIREVGAVITGYTGSGDVVIPMELGGFPVTGIATGAFGNLTVGRLVLPPTMETVAPGAFGTVTADELYFFDNLRTLEEASFSGYAIASVHIQAVEDPVYSGSYFDTLADKMDYLDSLKDRKKIVLFSGSSARFGFDSALMEANLPDYRVVNMGVYAYSNMLPLAKLILPLTDKGDILLHSPELDAMDTQFCGSNALDRETFCMMESNYDLFARLDCREFTNVFGAFSAYNAVREGMEPKSYQESASRYDEDGVPQLTATYNLQGDYILFRPNNDQKKTFGIKRAYYNPAYLTEGDIQGINRVYDAFREKGVRVLYSYSPRSSISISDDSTPQTVLALDAYLRQVLRADVIGSIEESLMDPLYFYGTDNHLSTEGVQIHTRRVIGDLTRYLSQQEEVAP